jgi:integrase
MPLELYDRNGKGIWWMRGTVADKRIHESCRTSQRKIAERIKAKREAEQWECNLSGPQAVLTFAQATLLYLQAGRTTRYVKKVSDFWGETRIADIKSGIVRSSSVRAYPKSGPATRNRQFITPTCAIVNHAAELDLCSPLRVRRFPVPTTARRVADWPWVQAFMAHSSPHLGALACFMFLTGARVSSAVNLEWGDVDLNRSEAVLRRTKNGDDHTVHLPPELIAALANIPWREGRVFGYAHRNAHHNVWTLACKRAGIPRLNNHAMRHGFATGLLHAGVDVKTVADRGGWRDTKIVMNTYAHAMQDKRVTEVLTAPLAHHDKPSTIKSRA